MCKVGSERECDTVKKMSIAQCGWDIEGETWNDER